MRQSLLQQQNWYPLSCHIYMISLSHPPVSSDRGCCAVPLSIKLMVECCWFDKIEN